MKAAHPLSRGQGPWISVHRPNRPIHEPAASAPPKKFKVRLRKGESKSKRNHAPTKLARFTHVHVLLASPSSRHILGGNRYCLDNPNRIGCSFLPTGTFITQQRNLLSQMFEDKKRRCERGSTQSQDPFYGRAGAALRLTRPPSAPPPPVPMPPPPVPRSPRWRAARPW